MNCFVAEKIPDECALNLGFAIIRDAIGQYARALVDMKKLEQPETKKEKERKTHAVFTKNEVENFFRGKWYRDLAEVIDFSFSGERIIKMVQKGPKKYLKAQSSGGRKEHDN